MSVFHFTDKQRKFTFSPQPMASSTNQQQGGAIPIPVNPAMATNGHGAPQSVFVYVQVNIESDHLIIKNILIHFEATFHQDPLDELNLIYTHHDEHGPVTMG